MEGRTTWGPLHLEFPFGVGKRLVVVAVAGWAVSVEVLQSY